MIEKYGKILRHYGIDKQLIKTVEELAELQVQLLKYFSSLSRLRTQTLMPGEMEKIWGNIQPEIADVENMLYQLKIYFNCFSEVDQIKEQKLDRTIERIKNNG